MRALMWLATVIALALWSLFAWGGRVAFEWIFGVFAVNVDQLALGGWASSLYSTAISLEQADNPLVFAIWFMGVLLIVVSFLMAQNVWKRARHSLIIEKAQK